MKFDCGETRLERQERREQWHKHFCWLPVKLGLHDCRWMEYVERRDYGHYFIIWKYRALAGETK